MFTDNPSYFTVPDEAQSTCGAFKRRQRMGNTDSISSASDCSLTRQLTPPRNQNRPGRSFLRSTSTNSADSNQELLIMGEPRLSDIAPDLAYKHPASRSNSVKSNKHEPHSDILYSPLPTSEEAAKNDEVFLSEDSARYYNFPNGRNGRRHSISSFRERTDSVTSTRSFKEDFPQAVIHATSEGESPGANSVLSIDDHLLRHASYPRKRCTRCTKGTLPKSQNMDDILIVSLKTSEAASLWVDYFSNYFQQISKQANRKQFKIQYLGAEDVVESKTEIDCMVTKTCGVKLQLVVICPSFLEFVSQNPEESSYLSKILLADRTLALLLGVTDNDLSDIHKTIFPSYFQWQRQSVGQDQDENFTKEFLGQAMAILSKVWKQQSSVISQEKSCFSVTPKKIRQGQNSVFILLTYPLQKEDIVKISIEKNNEIFEITSVKKRNPYIIKINVPENLTEVTAIVNILVEKNGSIIGSRPIKCESRLRELEQILRSSNNPVEFMCQTLGFSPADREQLDNWLVHNFQRNLPAHFNLLASHSTPFAAAVHAHKHSHEEFPTLLHFSAKFGLEKLSMQLLDCPGADLAYEIRNIYDMTPAELAETNNHQELASMLKGYMNMNEFTSMYAKLKEMSQNAKSEIGEDGYLAPKNIENLYKICPAPRPVIPEIQTPTTPTDFGTPVGYMAMNTHNKQSVTSLDHIEPEKKSPLPESHHKPKHHSSKDKLQKNCQIYEDKVQKELLEIINDFKNNVHSISQVEKLVDEWKNRNDVQKSFKEKQEQLLEMRQRYEKLQQEMKSAMKKPTPFDRIRKLFSRSKSREEKHEISSPVTSNSPVTIQASRPISSLSTSSSGSSGRMSTISSSSVGDSGTHSDNEERKNMLGSPSEDDLRNELNRAIMELNYKHVPAPKPVKPGMYNNRYKLFETIEERPVRPDNLPLTEEYYIQFPPSGLPVPGLVEIEDKKTNEYMNVEAPKQIETPDYMNYKVPTMR